MTSLMESAAIGSGRPPRELVVATRKEEAMWLLERLVPELASEARPALTGASPQYAMDW